jgi:hypothetical protein
LYSNRTDRPLGKGGDPWTVVCLSVCLSVVFALFAACGEDGESVEAARENLIPREPLRAGDEARLDEAARSGETATERAASLRDEANAIVRERAAEAGYVPGDISATNEIEDRFRDVRDGADARMSDEDREELLELIASRRHEWSPTEADLAVDEAADALLRRDGRVVRGDL